MKKKRVWGIYLFLFLTVAVLVWVYELWIIFAVPLCVTAWISVGRIKKCSQEEKDHEKRYHQVTTYLEQLLCSYRRLGHAGKAMEDCCTIFESGSEMGRALKRAVHVLLTGEGVADGMILEAAFHEVGSEFNSRRMQIIHRFICRVERTGGECGCAVDILLEDLELWKNRMKLYQNKKRFIRLECGIATVLAVILCYVSRLLTPDELGLCISDSAVYQISTVIVLMILFYIVSCIYRKLSGNWLDGKEGQDEKTKQRLEKLHCIVCGESEKSSTLSKHMAKKIVGRYVKNEFPYWLLLITLYLQTESSYQAFRYSMDETGGIFYRELEKLTQAIYDSPRDLEPYLDFFQGLELPEVQTGMKILYSVNANGYEDSKRQLDFLVAQNNRLMDKSERYKNANKMAGMSLLKQLPMVVSCLKLLIDLINLLALTMGSFQAVSF